MKNIKKLLFPVATIAASASLVTPLLTSCGATSTGIDEITKGYIPKIAKHYASGFADPDEMAADYLKAIKANPSILTEDNKYSSGQIYEMIAAYFETANSNASFKPELKVNSFKAGASDLSVNDDGQYTYKNGITTSLTAKIKLELPKILGSGEYDIVIDTKNLGFETKFTNFEKFDVSNDATLLEGSYTLVQPVFPADLTRDTWAVDFKLFGDLNVTVNNIEVVSLESINVDYHFDHDNIAVLVMSLPEQIPFLSSGIRIIDALQELGSFVSYYMSDVYCASRIFERNSHIVDFYNVDGDWAGVINFLKPADLDISTLAITHSSWQECEYGDLTAGESDVECYAPVTIKNLPIIGNETRFALVKHAYIEGYGENAYVNLWKERHTVYPRFNNTMKYSYDLAEGKGYWYTTGDSSIYTYDTMCVYNIAIDPTATLPATIQTNDTFYIKTNSELAISKYVFLDNVKIDLLQDGKWTTLVKGTDYSIDDTSTSIKFLKDFDVKGQKLQISLTSLSSPSAATAYIERA